MKTLTITDAKKNLSRWLDAAARGEDIGIIRGADIIALRRVEVESTDYAQREYGAWPAAIRGDAAIGVRAAPSGHSSAPSPIPRGRIAVEYVCPRFPPAPDRAE